MIAKPKKRIKWAKSEKEYAKLYGCDVRSIRNYKAAGYPLDNPSKMADVLASQRSSPGGSPTSLAGAKLEKLILECKRLEFKLQVDRKEYVPIAEVIADGTAIGAAMASSLDKLRADLPPLLLGLDEPGMAIVIEREINKIRSEIADKLKPNGLEK